MNNKIQLIHDEYMLLSSAQPYMNEFVQLALITERLIKIQSYNKKLKKRKELFEKKKVNKRKRMK